jgi:hypothetical protein
MFEQVHVEHGAVTWPGEIDLAPDAMHQAIQALAEWRALCARDMGLSDLPEMEHKPVAIEGLDVTDQILANAECRWNFMAVFFGILRGGHDEAHGTMLLERA